MTEFQRLSALLCSNCYGHIVLPNRNLQGRLPDQVYWPIGESSLAVVCHYCGCLCIYNGPNYRWESVQIPAPGQRATMFWRVEFRCDAENCQLPIVVHTLAESGSPHDLHFGGY